LGLGELAALAPYVALVALMWLNLRARHGSTPEEQEQNDDRDWNASSQRSAPRAIVASVYFFKDNGMI
jgi:hypothetical protein